MAALHHITRVTFQGYYWHDVNHHQQRYAPVLVYGVRHDRIWTHIHTGTVVNPMGYGPTIMLYCATTALDGYPLHSDKNNYIWMVTSFYIYSTTFYDLWQSSLPSSSLTLPIIFYFQLIFASIWAEPPASHIISSFPQHQQSSTCVMWWKVRQWRL